VVAVARFDKLETLRDELLLLAVTVVVVVVAVKLDSGRTGLLWCAASILVAAQSAESQADAPNAAASSVKKELLVGSLLLP